MPPGEVAKIQVPNEYKEALTRGARDPVFFCRYFLDYEPHEGQRKWLTNSTKDENILSTGNRWGKSDIAAAKRIWKMAYKTGWPEYDPNKWYYSVNASITADQAQIIWNKAYALLEQSPKLRWIIDDNKTKMTPFPTLVFRNKAQFQARSTQRNGVYLLGHDFDDFNFDEAAYQKELIKLLDNVVRMRLADREGTLDLTSTPNRRNDYYHLFLRGIEGSGAYDLSVYSQTGNSYENPYISHKRLKQLESKMTKEMRIQNIEGGFPDSSGQTFSGKDIEWMFDQDIVFENMGEIYEDGTAELCWDRPRRGHQYFHGWDLAKKVDWTVGWTIDIMQKPWKIVAYERFQRKPWPVVYERIRHRHNMYPNSETWIDCTGVGDAVLDELTDIKAQGLVFTGKSKVNMITNMQTFIEDHYIKSPWLRQPIDEFNFYEEDDKNLITDCVMAMGVLLWGLRDVAGAGFDPDALEILRTMKVH